ncbi:MAG: hypothetical protein AAGJ87_13515, partial [Pseudomonadota bacterium]
VDWAAVRMLLEETQARDRTALQRLTAGPRAATGAFQSEGLRTLAPERTPRIAPPELSRVAMPVLVPQTEEILATVRVYGQPDAYTANATAADGIDIRISGARKKLVLPAGSDVRSALQRRRLSRPPLPGLGARYVVTRSESSTDLSFSRFGCGYVLSVVCDAPARDPRCTQDDYIVTLADRMALLNVEAEGEE